MPINTPARLHDDLLDLYGEDQIALFVTATARKEVERWLNEGDTTIDNTLSLGKDGPKESTALVDYSLTFSKFLDQLAHESRHSKILRARLIVFTYMLWEKVYRPTICKECSVDSIESHAFGDLRLYRNAILHQNGKLDSDTKTLTVFGKDDIIHPTHNQLREIFQQLVIGLNDLGVRYYGENPDFK